MGPDTSFNLVRVVKMHARVQDRPSHIVEVYPNPAMASTLSADALVFPGTSVVARTPCTEHITRFNIRSHHVHRVHDGVEENYKLVFPALGLMRKSYPSSRVAGGLLRRSCRDVKSVSRSCVMSDSSNSKEL